MIQWLSLPQERRVQILTQASHQRALRADAIEKDWWVTLILKAVFETKWAPYLVFKGGTSLTKSWQLIERFSEDIDLAVDKELLGFAGTPNRSQLEQLRRKSSAFICGEFKEGLFNTLLALGVEPGQFELRAAFAEDSIRDPQVLELTYVSVLEPDPNPYLREKVLIEVGARSLREPSRPRPVTSMISEVFPTASFAAPPFPVQTVDPRRTFLEKVFLLHEVFYKGDVGKGGDRLSRHLYDLERLMDSEHAEAALQDRELYQGVVEHREIFNKVTGIDYTSHGPETVCFIPPEALRSRWEADYKAMQQHMIYGESLPFGELIKRLEGLQQRFRSIKREE